MMNIIEDKLLTEEDILKQTEPDFKEYSLTDIIGASVNTTIPFALKLQENYSFKPFAEEGFDITNPEVQDRLELAGITGDAQDRYSDAVSMDDLEDKIKFKEKVDNQFKILESLSLPTRAGLALATEVVNPINYLGYAGIKTAMSVFSNINKVATATTKVPQRAFGGTVGAIEGVAIGNITNESLEQDTTIAENLLYGGLGAVIGYSFVDDLLTPDMLKIKGKTELKADGLEVQSFKREHYLLPFMHSASDLMKTSINSRISELGHRISRSQDVTEVKDVFTANDYLREYKAHATKFNREYAEELRKFEIDNGRAFDETDEVELSRIRHKVYAKHIDNIEDISLQYKEKKFNEIREERTNLYNQKVTEYSNKLQMELDSKLQKIEAMPSNTEKQILKKQKALDTTKANYQKKLNKEASVFKNKFDRETNKVIKGYKFSDEELENIRVSAYKEAKDKLDSELESTIPSQYKSISDSITRFYKRYGEDIVKSDLNGKKNLNTDFYESAQWNLDKIAKDTDNAIDMLTNAMVNAGRKKGVDIDIAQAKARAEDFIDRILSKNSAFHSIDDNPLRGFKADPKQLKSRTLKIDYSDVIDYLHTNIPMNSIQYNRKMGGAITAKNVMGIDNRKPSDMLARELGARGEEVNYINKSAEAILGFSRIDPRANTMMSKILRGLNKVNYINFGGWFGANTLTDISTIAYDFGLHRTLRYATNDIITSLDGIDKSMSRKISNYIGSGGESFMHDRLALMGGETIHDGRRFIGEGMLDAGQDLVTKLSGLNYTIDFMERVSGMASMDYILTKSITDKKFIKTMNRLGLSIDDVKAIRNTDGLAKVGVNGISDLNLDKLDYKLQSKLERGLRRAISDTVLVANDIDSPMWLNEIFGSKALAMSLFQFMRFPVVSYNKLFRKMTNNFDVLDATISTLTVMSIMSLVLQAKEIGKEEKRYGFEDKDTTMNTISKSLQYVPLMPQLGGIGSFIGNAENLFKDDKDPRLTIPEAGISIPRLMKALNSGKNFINGSFDEGDERAIFGYATTNVPLVKIGSQLLNEED